MNPHDLDTTARALVAPGKGILAADESAGTIKKRFEGIKLEPTEENGRRYREMLFTAAGAAEHVSGVILFDATIRQSTKGGQRFTDLLASQGIIPGIKVDAGTMPLPGRPGELISAGADGLRKRLAEYYAMGARFAKGRAVIDIAPGIPSALCLSANAEALAHYAACCQAEGIVPIVEPDVLMDGDHSIDRCFEVTHLTLRTVFGALLDQRVALDGILLKPNMVIPGKKHSGGKASPDAVAEATIKCFRDVVPAAVPGIVFLSGGQGDEEATANLDAINKRGPHPWEFSFSDGRALQAPALKAWGGSDGNIAAGQAAYAKRAKLNGLARNGKYESAMESAG